MRVLSGLLLLLVLMIQPGCSENDDGSPAPAADDDIAGDDDDHDAGGDDDNDVAVDDDNDSADDDDDDSDDDDDDDDDDNDDDDDDDNDDDDNDDDNDDDISPPPVAIEAVDGGAAGHSGVSIAVAGDGTVYLAAARGRNLRLFTLAGGASTEEEVAPFGDMPSLALDGVGRVHIAFHDMVTDELKYGLKDGGVWTIETVVPADWNRGRTPRLAVDRDGFAHLEYAYGWQSWDLDLGYATNRSGAWQRATLPLGVVLEQWLGIAVDPAGAVHLSFCSETYGQIQYATNASGQWMAEDVDPGGETGAHSAIALDAVGAPTIVYNSPWGEVRRAVRDGGGWDVGEIEDLENGDGLTPEMAIGADGAVRAVYRTNSPRRARFADNAAGNWAAEPLASASQAALALDGADTPHVALFDPATGSLELAVRDGRGWSVTTVDEGGSRGGDTAVAVDSAGASHIVYCDNTNDRLLYATNQSGAWRREELDAAGCSPSRLAVGPGDSLAALYAVGADDELRCAVREGDGWTIHALDLYAFDRMGFVVDADGVAHMSYSSGLAPGLVYATWDGGTLDRQTIDPTWGAGYESSLAIDADGAAHVAYADYPTAQWWLLKYARQTGEAWEIETIEENQYDFDDPALSLDATGRPCVAYCANIYSRQLRFGCRDAAGWRLEGVEWGDSVGIDTKLLLAPDGTAHIFHWNGVGVKYDTDRFGGWSDFYLDWGNDGFGEGPAAALGGDGVFRVSYSGDEALHALTFPLLWR